MIKKTLNIVILTAVIVSASSITLPVFASEISGTISTNGGGTNTGIPTSSEISGQINSTLTAILAHTSSEISGQITMNQNTQNVGGGDMTNHSVPINYNSGGSGGSNETTQQPSSPTSPIDDTSGYTMDLAAFGPRSGYAPDTSILSYATPIKSGTSRSSNTLVTPDENVADTTILPPYAGGGLGNTSDLTASANNTSLAHAGLSAAQLSYIAFVALLVIASMGYAISRSNREQEM